MNRSTGSEPIRQTANRLCIRPKLFVFFEKKSGTRRFAVKPAEHGGMPLDEAASLLAIHCLGRQQSPRDFGVMVETRDDLFEGLALRATKLIRAFSGCRAPHALSRRQRDVICRVSRNLSNKEIGAELNISERTVKFHVSTLLEKFGVRNRVELMFKAAEFNVFEQGLAIGQTSERAAVPIGGIARSPARRAARAIIRAPQHTVVQMGFRQSAER